jgi:hypothetical protein
MDISDYLDLTSLDTWEGLGIIGICIGLVFTVYVVLIMFTTKIYIPNFWIYTISMGLTVPFVIYILYAISHLIGFWLSWIVLIITGIVMYLTPVSRDPHIHQL